MNTEQLQNEDVKFLGLPQPDQIGFVVKDLQKAMQLYAPLFGPFHCPEFGSGAASYKGGERTPFELKFAFGKIGHIEIELIEYISGDTPHRDFLAARHEGMHHLRFRVDNLDEWLAKVGEIGYETVWIELMSDEIGYAYCEREGDPLVLEFLQYTVGNPI